MKAVARIYWTFFTAFKVQRWLGALGLVVLGLGVVVGLVDLLIIDIDHAEVGIGFPLGLIGFAVCVLIPTSFTTGGILRALSAPQGHALLPHFRVRILVAIALFVGSIALLWYVAGAGIVWLDGDGAPEGGLAVVEASTLYVIGALSAVVLSVFVITGNPNWAWLTLAAIFAVGRWREADGPRQLAAAGISLPWIVGVVTLSAWIVFAIWYLRARRIRPVLLMALERGLSDLWWRQTVMRPAKHWPAELTSGRAMGTLLTGRLQRTLPQQLLIAAGVGVLLCFVAPLLQFLPGPPGPPRPTTLPFTVFVWPFYAMLFTLFAAHLIVRQSRRAWLRVPGQRTQVFRVVERQMARLYLRVVTCTTTLVLVSMVVFGTPPTEGAWGVALMASAALYSACLGLASVRTVWPLAFGLLVMFVVQAVVLGVERDQAATSQVAALLGIELEAQQAGALLGIQLAAAGVFRAVAELRWRRIDWLRFRPLRLGRSAGV